MSHFQPTHVTKVINKELISALVATSLLLNNKLDKEAGENLVIGDPIWVASDNKFYKADNVTNPQVIGLITTAALTGFLASATISDKVTLSGLTPVTPYFLGNQVITSTPPSSGNVIRLGLAISTTELILNIEEPILLS